MCCMGGGALRSGCCSISIKETVERDEIVCGKVSIFVIKTKTLCSKTNIFCECVL